MAILARNGLDFECTRSCSMQHMTPQHTEPLPGLNSSRYALLHSYDSTGRPVDTPIWFAVEGTTLYFRSKIGPKTRRIERHPEVELRSCDHRGRTDSKTPVFRGVATVIDGAAAEEANALLHDRYGWQWNVVPMIKIPGVVNVHRSLGWRDKLRRSRSKTLWPDSAIVRVDLLDS